ncbi:MAG: mercuric reductase [Deltaproteobacteria bacterium]|nr:mercuric reductase [Deltaproteobacteria bacterium]
MSEDTHRLTIEPQDASNQKLVENVHPSDWQNPTPKDRYHLVVLGGGTAGLVSAAGAAGLGARVALVEKHFLGGDCLNFGCVPSKAVIRAARAWHEASHGEEFGAPRSDNDGDFAAVMARMRRLRADISGHDSAQRFSDLGVDVFLGEGKFVASDALEIGGERLEFRRAVIATGGRAFVPPIPGLQEAGFLTNENVFSLTHRPASLVVIGGGPIGCELAQSFARFGTSVTLVDMAPQILPREDPDAAKVVDTSLHRDGVSFVLSAKVIRVEATETSKVVVVEVDGQEKRLEAEEILLSVGRAANVKGLGLEAAGVKFDRKGVSVDATLRTSNDRIFAAGDVASRYQFTHTADAMARIVLRNALFPFGRKRSTDLVIPWCTFTSPEIAHVGLYEHEAQERGQQVDTLTLPLGDNDRALLDGETEGFLRLHLAKGSDRILGATLVAEHAGEMISEITLAITQGIGLGKIASTIHPYPTQSEIFKRAADTWFRTKLTPTKKRWLERYFSFQR